MNMKFAAAAALGLLSCAAMAPQAAAADNGFYLGAGLTQTNFDISFDFEGESVSGDEDDNVRVVMSFPTNPDDMLLSGVLVGGQALSGRAQVLDAPLGEGHVVSFAIRPFWRWQTHGTYTLGFNALMNWNDLGQ